MIVSQRCDYSKLYNITWGNWLFEEIVYHRIDVCQWRVWYEIFVVVSKKSWLLYSIRVISDIIGGGCDCDDEVDDVVAGDVCDGDVDVDTVGEGGVCDGDVCGDVDGE